MTTRGAVIGGWLGLISASVLVLIGPTVWTEILGKWVIRSSRSSIRRCSR